MNIILTNTIFLTSVFSEQKTRLPPRKKSYKKNNLILVFIQCCSYLGSASQQLRALPWVGLWCPRWLAQVDWVSAVGYYKILAGKGHALGCEANSEEHVTFESPRDWRWPTPGFLQLFQRKNWLPPKEPHPGALRMQSLQVPVSGWSVCNRQSLVFPLDST